MKTYTYVHLCSYIANFFLEWEMIQTKVVEKMKIHFIFWCFTDRASQYIYLNPYPAKVENMVSS